MATEKQIAANRRNAQKSTGPKTPEGKARVSRNALRHGLAAEHTVIDGEDPDEFAEFKADFYDHLQPQGPVEAHLVHEIVSAAWRLRRIHIIETGFFDLRLADLEEDIEEDYGELEPNARKAFVYRRDTQGSNTLEMLSRYQARAERSFYKALRELERLQSGRAKPLPQPECKEPVPAPQLPEPIPLSAPKKFDRTNPISSGEVTASARPVRVVRPDSEGAAPPAA